VEHNIRSHIHDLPFASACCASSQNHTFIHDVSGNTQSELSVHTSSAVQTDHVEMVPSGHTCEFENQIQHEHHNCENSKLAHDSTEDGFASESQQNIAEQAHGLHTLDWKNRFKRTHVDRSFFKSMAENSAVLMFLYQLVGKAGGKFQSLREPPRSGMLYNIVKSPWFEVLCCTAIVLNSLMLGVVADHQLRSLGEEQLEYANLMENAFLCVYLGELLLKVAVHRCYFFLQ